MTEIQLLCLCSDCCAGVVRHGGRSKPGSAEDTSSLRLTTLTTVLQQAVSAEGTEYDFLETVLQYLAMQDEAQFPAAAALRKSDPEIEKTVQLHRRHMLDVREGGGELAVFMAATAASRGRANPADTAAGATAKAVGGSSGGGAAASAKGTRT